MPYLEDGTPDPAQVHRPDFSRARTIAQDRDPVAGVASVAGRVAARLKEEVNQTEPCCFCLHAPAVK